MNNSIFKFKQPANEPVLSYAPGSKEREALKAELKRQSEITIDIPLIIGGKEVRTGDIGTVVMPHNHSHILATYHKAGTAEVAQAIEAALEARKQWSQLEWEERASVLLKVGELLAGKYRYLINAATMLGQSKNAYQAEIDSACEIIDFLRFNTYFASEIYSIQPNSDNQAINRLEYRPLEGFVYCVSPFNFTSIAGNLNAAPVLMGNVTVWKPATTAILSNYYLMKIFQEAGLPDGVINFLPGQGSVISSVTLNDRNLAGIHFTGSTRTFNEMWKTVGNNPERYKTYPKLVGETGGKDFIFAHPSADREALLTALIRGAFEYQGQKCSAASRAYIPESIWADLKAELAAKTGELKQGIPDVFGNFVNAVIDEKSFDNIMSYIAKAKQSDSSEVIAGGKGDKSTGYYVQPTVIATKDPHFVTLEEEIFGPVLTIYVYHDADFEKTLELCDNTSQYALTGAVFAKCRYAIETAKCKLKYAAGNFYVNDKPTGAVVGQQPFGGARASGTNDKAGCYLNLLRWVSPRTVKETLVPATDYSYPFLAED
ncbi:MAG: L-glutamate gamma-semialdehyde dehydrogenase [Prevotellaceae bacterium]|jgi:1-pyrroline-5-carboxylate dehydrogenase|nr:L-glutamate gamma-semialdehyde dehydrogenase [Prevotellaceae bacterium]